MKMTQHYLERAKERSGLKEKQAQREAGLAMKCGKSLEDFCGKKREFFEKREAVSGAQVFLWKDEIYIANMGYMITTYKAPAMLRKGMFYSNKEKIRKPKQYFTRYHSSDKLRAELR